MPETIESQQAALRNANASSVELVGAALERATAPEGEGGRVFTALYAHAARAAARASDLLRGVGASRSSIDGLAISVKDLFDIAGEVTTAGSVVQLSAAPAREDALAIRRLRAAGAVIVGRTNMTEFAYSGLGINPHYGTPRNPWDRRQARIPGGSSSGAAVSVSDGMAVAAVGSDTGGSVRIPAALCGLTGFKPTAGRVSMAGMLPLSTALDSIGPIANSVTCCAQLDAVLAGEDGQATRWLPASLRGLRLMVPTTVVMDSLDNAVAGAFAAALNALSAAGAEITETALPELAEVGAINPKGLISAAHAWAWHRAIIARAGERYDPRVVSRIVLGRDIGAADYLDAVAGRQRWIVAVTDRLAGFDALLMPTVPVVAPTLAEVVAGDTAYFANNALMLRNPSLINFLDGCALTLPCHAIGTAPVGLTLAAAGGADRRILSIGLAVEALLAQRRG